MRNKFDIWCEAWCEENECGNNALAWHLDDKCAYTIRKWRAGDPMSRANKQMVMNLTGLTSDEIEGGYNA